MNVAVLWLVVKQMMSVLLWLSETTCDGEFPDIQKEKWVEINNRLQDITDLLYRVKSKKHLLITRWFWSTKTGC